MGKSPLRSVYEWLVNGFVGKISSVLCHGRALGFIVSPCIGCSTWPSNRDNALQDHKLADYIRLQTKLSNCIYVRQLPNLMSPSP